MMLCGYDITVMQIEILSKGLDGHDSTSPREKCEVKLASTKRIISQSAVAEKNKWVVTVMTGGTAAHPSEDCHIMPLADLLRPEKDGLL